MSRKFKITKKAERNFEEILDYLLKRFGQTTTNKFIDRTTKLGELLVIFPEIGQLADKSKGIYSFVQTKQTTVFYRFSDFEVIILKFFDTRQHPNKKLE